MAEGKGKGKEHYLTYTHEELWNMLFEGDSWSVEQAGSIWSSAASGLQAAREEMGAHVLSLRSQWSGKAAEEFENRMAVIEQYSLEAEDGMKNAGENRVPGLAAALDGAKSDAQAGDLYPSSTESYEEWLESKGIEETDPTYESKRPQYEQQYQEYVDQRHENMAQIVANLGDHYAHAAGEWKEPPPPPPSDMPGNESYQPPTGGVFGGGGLNSPGSGNPPGPVGSTGENAGGSDGLNSGDPDDLEPVGDWNPGSYTDVDSDFEGGGLASGFTPGGAPPVGGGGLPTGGTGGSTTLTGGGGGLFGPRGGGGGGTGSTSGRGTGSNSPARAGANNSSRTGGSGRGTGQNPTGRGAGQNSSGRGTGQNSSGRGTTGRGGMNNRGMGPRGGTRSGYNNDDDDEETTRETWLREDDVNWGRNRTSDDELDD